MREYRSTSFGKLAWMLAAVAAAQLISCGSDDDESGGAGTSGLPNCSSVCAQLMALGCPGGPPTPSECLTPCEQFRSGPCADRFRTLSNCAGGTPTFACDSGGLLTVTGCETEYNALIACVAAP